jgi:hypothetical protein
MASAIGVYDSIWGSYLTPEEAMSADSASTDRTLGAVIAMLAELYLEKRNVRMELEQTEVEEEIAELEWRIKMIRNEESSLHRIESGLQSRLKVP